MEYGLLIYLKLKGTTKIDLSIFKELITYKSKAIIMLTDLMSNTRIKLVHSDYKKPNPIGE